MSEFIFNTTPSILHKNGGAAKLGEIILEQSFAKDVSNILFVTDPGIMKLGLADEALDSLLVSGFSITIFSEVEADPKVETILEAVRIVKESDIACVIGFGGGSSMDVAKLVALLGSSKQTLDDMYGVNLATGIRLPLVLVPTTAGTGSEVTPISIVTTGTSEKKGVVSPLLLPDLALLDATLTVGLPPHITAATGVDAMVHAIEAFTSTSPNNNPISKGLAKQALELLGANINQAVTSGDNLEARTNMLLGSMLAGQAFANSPVAAVHALAYPIGSLFKVPHGLSNALVLPQVMRFNADACSEQYAGLAPIVFPNIDVSKSTKYICDEFITKIAALNVDLGLQAGLKQVGITEGDIDKLAEDAMNQTRLLQNNPRELSLDDIKQIYRQSL